MVSSLEIERLISRFQDLWLMSSLAVERFRIGKYARDILERRETVPYHYIKISRYQDIKIPRRLYLKGGRHVANTAGVLIPQATTTLSALYLHVVLLLSTDLLSTSRSHPPPSSSFFIPLTLALYLICPNRERGSRSASVT